jgi:hypothetical protein
VASGCDVVVAGFDSLRTPRSSGRNKTIAKAMPKPMSAHLVKKRTVCLSVVTIVGGACKAVGIPADGIAALQSVASLVCIMRNSSGVRIIRFRAYDSPLTDAGAAACRLRFCTSHCIKLNGVGRGRKPSCGDRG